MRHSKLMTQFFWNYPDFKYFTHLCKPLSYKSGADQNAVFGFGWVRFESQLCHLLRSVALGKMVYILKSQVLEKCCFLSIRRKENYTFKSIAWCLAYKEYLWRLVIFSSNSHTFVTYNLFETTEKLLRHWFFNLIGLYLKRMGSILNTLVSL